MSTSQFQLPQQHVTGSAESVLRERIRAHLNLFAVLQNLEELVRLDAQAAEIVGDSRVSVQFQVWRGPSAYLEFRDGQCRHGRGRPPSPDVVLFFFSPRHLNAMFDGKANPAPIRGFRKLSWLKNEFTQITERLGHVLGPPEGELDEDEARLRATLLLQTGAYATAELAALEPTCQQVAARIADGILSVDVLPHGPRIHGVVADGHLRIVKRAAEQATARLTIRSPNHAIGLLENRLDTFDALATGDLEIAGQIAMIDDFLLILDRVTQFVS